VTWGMDRQAEHERWLVEEHGKRPVAVTNYPKEIEVFYMRVDPDGRTVSAMDILVPRMGAIIGGFKHAVRERIDIAAITRAKLASFDLDRLDVPDLQRDHRGRQAEAEDDRGPDERLHGQDANAQREEGSRRNRRSRTPGCHGCHLRAGLPSGQPRRPPGAAMIRPNPNGDYPTVPESAFVDPTAIVCGKVVLGDRVFVGPYAVIRADELAADGSIEPIVIGEVSNIQDGVVIHSKAGASVRVGRGCSIAHRAIIHGPCTIGDGVFIGFNSVVFNCEIGDGSVIRHNSVVENCHIPAGFHIPSTTTIHADAELARVPRVDPDVTSFSESVVATNQWLVEGYKRIRNEL
jgi:carbonic anhydrase/acetyltransferase-like protein (isoleucine patch superfamily)